MDIDDAMERVQAGHVIARPCWVDDNVVRPRTERVVQGVVIGWVSGRVLTLADTAAEDWVDLGPLQ